MATRVWRTLDKFDLKTIGSDVLEAEPGTELEWELELNGTQVDAYISCGNSREYVCSMSKCGQIQELKPNYANHFA